MVEESKILYCPFCRTNALIEFNDYGSKCTHCGCTLGIRAWKTVEECLEEQKHHKTHQQLVQEAVEQERYRCANFLASLKAQHSLEVADVLTQAEAMIRAGQHVQS